MNIPDAAIGSIIAAVIAAFAGAMSLIISKEVKISEFRLAWIEALRAEVAALYCNLVLLKGVLRKYGRSEEGQQKGAEMLRIANEYFARIRLRLNRDETEFGPLTKLLDDIEKTYVPKGDFDFDRMTEINSELLEETRSVLRREWRKVHRGEPLFRFARGLLLVLVLIGAAAIWIAYRSGG